MLLLMTKHCIGALNSLNLRNVVWHGFFTRNDLQKFGLKFAGSAVVY
jgi:hypothetical protein